MFKSEWSYLVHHKMMLVVLVAIALIPAIYCFIYLSSMWDTYGKMDRIPVAIVDHDTPVTYHGKRIAIGQNLTTSLLQADALDFHHVSAATAEKRLRAGRYYMILTVPQGFSQKATTIMGENPQRMNLYFRFNSGQNFIVSKMTNGAATAIKAKVSAQVTKMYAGIVLSALGSAQAGMQKAAAGGTQLAAGSEKLLAGETQLASGTRAMGSGVGQLTAGNAKLASGNTAMASGFTQLTANTPKLTSGLSQIQSGLTQLAAKSPQLAQGTAQLATLAQAIQQQLTSGAANPTRLTAETMALTRGLQALTPAVRPVPGAAGSS
ncbi:YhgE/Pip domain-containing protein [Schleiferilactobacillus shenzhenensis]|uniref:ABC-2 type transporter transmembrane domain-containing protein n=1 Tax=Schleiferilactobacillus shenzhenensis LY-73 TaxID=1231336 RepID=U4TNX8_9LACO|nr:YhgE/Pip domain-containing protein [Schleiferilactobacillus shenzhenensis]ERL65909.1 hypothetical protein L248_1985 [Schleiferilactobacillus shenzhenensis LY-73]